MLRLPPLYVINRATGTKEPEAIYGEWGLALLYGNKFFSCLRWLISRGPFFSRFYGWLQDRPRSRKKVAPFVEKYGVDASEFEKPVEDFVSFNDFFTRKLKPGARPIAKAKAVMPADGRYRFFPKIDYEAVITVKGQSFSLPEFLGDARLAAEYDGGAMLLARLCPTDYHRFHFPCDGVPGESVLIDGRLASVNPFPLEQRIRILAENKRMLCRFQTSDFGQVLIVEIGATSVGTIAQTYEPHVPVEKGAEKGFFAFGGSAMAVLFKTDTIEFCPDLLAQRELEIKCLVGEKLCSG